MTRSAGGRLPQRLLVTVGENPLPALASILTLRPAHVCYAVTGGPAEQSGSRRVALRVQQQLETLAGEPNATLDAPEAQYCEVSAHGYADTVTRLQDAGKGWDAGWDVDYTGGTKVMSAAAYETWADAEGGRAWYVADAENRLVDHTGSTTPLCYPPRHLTLDELAALHGAALHHFHNLPDSALEVVLEKETEALENLRQVVERLDAANGTDPSANWEKVWEGRSRPQMVARVTGWRLHLLAVRNTHLEMREEEGGRRRRTLVWGVDHKNFKLAAFEVEERAHQIGGTLARSAVASTTANSNMVNEVRRDLGSDLRPWKTDEGSVRQPACTVLGSMDLRQAETGPELAVLTDWLRS